MFINFPIGLYAKLIPAVLAIRFAICIHIVRGHQNDTLDADMTLQILITLLVFSAYLQQGEHGCHTFIRNNHQNQIQNICHALNDRVC